MTTTLALILPIMVAAAASAWLFVLGWRRRRNATAVWFAVLAATAAAWCALEVAAYLTTGTTKLVITSVRYGPITLLPVAWLLFSAAYTNLASRIAMRHVLALLVVPIVTVLLLATNDLHHAMFVRRWVVYHGAIQVTGHEYGWWFWVHTTYSYLLLAGGVLLAVSRLRHAVRSFRGQAWVMLAGALAPAIANVVYLGNYQAFSYVDPTPVAFAVSTIFFGIGLFRYDLLDIVPVARNHVFDRIGDPVVVFDFAGRILDMNVSGRTMVGAENDGFTGHPASDGLLATAWELRRDPGPHEHEILIGEEYHWISWSMVELATGPDLGRGWMFYGHDVTDRRRREEELVRAKEAAEEMSRMKSVFLSNMNHEFRTPLSGIIGLSDVLEEEIDGEHRQLIQLIRQGGERLLATLDSVLAVADLDSGSIDLMITTVDVCQVAAELVAEFRPEAQSKHLSVTVDAPSDPVWARLDPGRIRQAMRQIVGNAIKYTARGRVVIGVSSDGDEVALFVRDTGRGIAAEFIPRLFDGFTQESQGHDREFEGAGLGLRIANGLVERMGGHIDVESSLDDGSVFTVRFPRIIPEPPAHPRHPIRRGVRPGSAVRGTA